MANTYLTINEVALLLKISKKTIYKLIKDGRFPAFKIGNKYRFTEHDIKAYFTANK